MVRLKAGLVAVADLEMGHFPQAGLVADDDALVARSLAGLHRPPWTTSSIRIGLLLTR